MESVLADYDRKKQEKQNHVYLLSIWFKGRNAKTFPWNLWIYRNIISFSFPSHFEFRSGLKSLKSLIDLEMLISPENYKYIETYFNFQCQVILEFKVGKDLKSHYLRRWGRQGSKMMFSYS